MDTTIPAAEANRSFSRLLQQVRQGESFTITAHGRPVARIVPWDAPEQDRSAAKRVLLDRLAGETPLDGVRWTRDELYER